MKMNKRKLRSEYIESIKLLEFKKLDMRKFYTTHCYNGNFWKKPCVSSLDFALEECQRKFNETILKPIRKHPEIVLSNKIMNELEENTKQIVNQLPQDEIVVMPYWDKFFKAIDLCYNYIKNKEIKHGHKSISKNNA